MRHSFYVVIKFINTKSRNYFIRILLQDINGWKFENFNFGIKAYFKTVLYFIFTPLKYLCIRKEKCHIYLKLRKVLKIKKYSERYSKKCSPCKDKVSTCLLTESQKLLKSVLIKRIWLQMYSKLNYIICKHQFEVLGSIKCGVMIC